ncbi:MAG: hypothetical protein ACO1QR_11930 [Chthoniobacteraceae bacterium]
MDPTAKKLSQRTLEELQNEQQQVSQGGKVREFAEVEDLLRYDAAQAPLPPAVEERLKSSVRDFPPRRSSWWQRLFRR